MIDKSLQQFSDLIKGGTVFIIGGGASLRDFDFDILKGKITIAINSAMYFMEPTAIFWCDGRWAAQHEDKLTSSGCYKFGATTLYNPPTHSDDSRNRYTLGRSLMVYRTGIEGYDSNFGCVKGNNSGTMAINMCSNMGAKRIVLLGFDLGATGERSHFHDNLQDRIADSVYQNEMVPNFEILHAHMQRLGVRTEVVNCSLQSKLQIFNKTELEHML